MRGEGVVVPREVRCQHGLQAEVFGVHPVAPFHSSQSADMQSHRTAPWCWRVGTPFLGGLRSTASGSAGGGHRGTRSCVPAGSCLLSGRGDVVGVCDAAWAAAKHSSVSCRGDRLGCPRRWVTHAHSVLQNYTQYIPLSVYDLQTWMGSPSIFVYDCSNAGLIVKSFKQFALQREQELEVRAAGRQAGHCVWGRAWGLGTPWTRLPASCRGSSEPRCLGRHSPRHATPRHVSGLLVFLCHVFKESSQVPPERPSKSPRAARLIKSRFAWLF